MEKRSLGVIFHRNDFGEADRILHILTEDYGKVDVVAKGVRKMKAQLGGSVEPFCLTEFLLLGKSELKTLRSAQIKESFSGIHSNFEAMTACAVMGEVLRYGSMEENDEAELFWLFVEVLRLLNTNQYPVQFLLSIFFLKYLYLNGSSIDFIHCGSCDCILDQGAWLDTTHQCMQCPSCTHTDESVELIEKRILKILSIVSSTQLDVVLRLDLQKSDISHIFFISKDLIQGFLGRDLQSYV